MVRGERGDALAGQESRTSPERGPRSPRPAGRWARRREAVCHNGPAFAWTHPRGGCVLSSRVNNGVGWPWTGLDGPGVVVPVRRPVGLNIADDERDGCGSDPDSSSRPALTSQLCCRRSCKEWSTAVPSTGRSSRPWWKTLNPRGWWSVNKARARVRAERSAHQREFSCRTVSPFARMSAPVRGAPVLGHGGQPPYV